MFRTLLDAGSEQDRTVALTARLILFALLFFSELPFIAFLFDPLAINGSDPLWLTVRAVLREAVPVVLYFAILSALLLWTSRIQLLSTWRKDTGTHSWGALLVANLILFLVLVVSTPAFNSYGAARPTPPWLLFGFWSASAVVMYMVLILSCASWSFWKTVLRQNWPTLAIAAVLAILVQSFAILSRESWSALSRATFDFSGTLLKSFEPDVLVDPDRYVLGIGKFKVSIASACSGYEGIGLIATFLIVYLWIFRKSLRFPNAYLLLPIGIAAIWTLNGVRIAALVAIGAHISPSIAVTGFHSQAGWMAFLAVTVGLMAVSHRLAFFRRLEEISPAIDSASRSHLAAAYLTPALAMLAAGMVAAAFSARGEWLYLLKVAAIVFALLAFRDVYRQIELRISLCSVAIGVLVAIVWIGSDPNRNAASDPLGVWVNNLSPGAAIVWIAIRVIGTTLLVPISEELAIRGYVHRKLIAERFETVPMGQFSWRAFLLTTLLFAALHDRWFVGAIAGAAFAVTVYRTNRIADPIVAHMTANGLIVLWAISMDQWSLL